MKKYSLNIWITKDASITKKKKELRLSSNLPFRFLKRDGANSKLKSYILACWCMQQDSYISMQFLGTLPLLPKVAEGLVSIFCSPVTSCKDWRGTEMKLLSCKGLFPGRQQDLLGYRHCPLLPVKFCGQRIHIWWSEQCWWNTHCRHLEG